MKQENLKWWVLFTVIIGTFLGRLDQTIVGLGTTKIMDAFGITLSAAGWISTASIIANAVFVPVWGKLGDTIGRKKIYLLGFSIFLVGSTLAALSWNFGSLIFFRVIQAIASSADYPTAMAIITVTFAKGKERAQALGLWSASFAAAAVFGPLIGGPIIDLFGWRAVFLINIPIGFIGILMAIRFINESVSEKKTVEFDLLGAITLGVMLASLVLVLDKGNDWGWTSATSLICYFLILIFGFIFYKTEKNHKEPIVDFKFFKNKIFNATLFNNFVVFMGMMGCMFLIPVFLQTFLGYTATTSGYIFIPMAAGMMISAQIGGRLVGKVKSNNVIFISTLIASAGIYMFSLFLDIRSNVFDIILPLFVLAFGIGLGMAQRTSAIASAVPEHEIGIASSVLALMRNIAGAFGIAIFATILNNSVNTNLVNLSQNSIINNPSAAVYSQVVPLMIIKAQMLAYSTVFKISALIVFLGAIAVLFFKINDDKDINKNRSGKIHLE